MDFREPLDLRKQPAKIDWKKLTALGAASIASALLGHYFLGENLDKYIGEAGTYIASGAIPSLIYLGRRAVRKR